MSSEYRSACANPIREVSGADSGKLVLNIRYGARVIELAKGKSSIEMAGMDDLVPTLELVKRAVEAGELDAQLDAAALKLRDGFGK